MLDLLTDTEKEIMYMLIQGQNFNGISDFIGIDYQEYITLKNQYLKIAYYKDNSNIAITFV